MRKLFALLIIMLPLMLLVSSCNELTTPVESTSPDSQQLEKGNWFHGGSGNIIIANRNSGSISVIDTKTDEVTGTYPLWTISNSGGWHQDYGYMLSTRDGLYPEEEAVKAALIGAVMEKGE
jgi:hypothetical protein